MKRRRRSNPVGAAKEATRERLLEVAGEVFAERGFRDTTVRDICTRARANVAAVNYHFRHKQGLYREVLQAEYAKGLAAHPPGEGADPDAGIEERFRAFVRAFMFRIFDSGRGAGSSFTPRLMVREMVDPTPALDVLVNRSMRPLSEMFLRIVAQILGRSPKDRLVRDCAASVIGQCLFYHHCRPVIVRLFPGFRYTRPHIAALADHIADFSLSALRSMRRRRAPSGKGGRR